MELYEVVLLVAAILIGAIMGWVIRGEITRWCTLCGRRIGRVCNACHNNEIRYTHMLSHSPQSSGLHASGGL